MGIWDVSTHYLHDGFSVATFHLAQVRDLHAVEKRESYHFPCCVDSGQEHSQLEP